MASGIFRLLVYAVAALALLAAFYLYLEPLFFPSQDAVGEISKKFDAAQLAEGKLFEARLSFSKDFSLSGSNFDSKSRATIFKCLDATFCCVSEVKGCKLVVESRRLRVKENLGTDAYFRCVKEADLSVCSAYFGALRPAELSIKKTELSEKAELPINKLTLEVANNGETIAKNVKAEVKVYKTEASEGKYLKTLASIAQAEFSEIGPKASASQTIDLQVREPGNYLAELRVYAEDSGFETRELKFEAVGGTATIDSCLALEAGKKEFRNGQCIQPYLCAGCKEAYECSLARPATGIL